MQSRVVRCKGPRCRHGEFRSNFRVCRGTGAGSRRRTSLLLGWRVLDCPPVSGRCGARSKRLPSGRFKYQRRIDGRWTDLSSYRPVLDVPALYRSLQQQNFSTLPDLDPDELRGAVRSRPERLHSVLRRIFSVVVDNELQNPLSGRLAGAHDYFAQFRQDWAGDEHYEYFLAYFSLLRLSYRSRLGRLSTPTDVWGGSGVDLGLGGRGRRTPRVHGGASGKALILGQITVSSIEVLPLRNSQSCARTGRMRNSSDSTSATRGR